MSRALNKFEIPIEKFAICDDKIENDLKLLENESEVVVRDKPEEKEIKEISKVFCWDDDFILLNTEIKIEEEKKEIKEK